MSGLRAGWEGMLEDTNRRGGWAQRGCVEKLCRGQLSWVQDHGAPWLPGEDKGRAV